jgi:hypothetical protein
MKVYWPTDKAIWQPTMGTVTRVDPDTGELDQHQVVVGGDTVHHPAGTPFEMPDDEAQDRIRQGDCLPWVEPSSDAPVETPAPPVLPAPQAPDAPAQPPADVAADQHTQEE